MSDEIPSPKPWWRVLLKVFFFVILGLVVALLLLIGVCFAGAIVHRPRP